MNWKEKLKDYPEDDEVLQLYEEWGDTPYLKEVFNALSQYNPDWNKEKELGAWAADFISELLDEMEGDLSNLAEKERIVLINEWIQERYPDFCSGHQFVRVNTISLQQASENPEDLYDCIQETGETIGFPVLL